MLPLVEIYIYIEIPVYGLVCVLLYQQLSHNFLILQYPPWILFSTFQYKIRIEEMSSPFYYMHMNYGYLKSLSFFHYKQTQLIVCLMKGEGFNADVKYQGHDYCIKLTELSAVLLFYFHYYWTGLNTLWCGPIR